MNFSVQVLGSNSAIPTLTRNPSAHLLKADERLFLIDCAEGTQLQLRRYHVHFLRINHIFISHLHGDHFYGLIGLITSFHLLGRKDKLHIYAHDALREIIEVQLKASDTRLIYPVEYHSLSESTGQRVNKSTGKAAVIFEDETLIVSSFPLLHSVPTSGFLFREKPQPRRIRKEMIEKYRIPVEWMSRLKSGEDYIDDLGRIHKNTELTTDPPMPRTYAYCTDTAYSEDIIPYIQNADLLYHEATFLSDKAVSAREKLHSTAAEAATIAKLAGVKKLLIGHFSARYDEPGVLLEEAREIFPQTEMAEDGKIVTI